MGMDKDFEKIAGLEEVLNCLDMITYIDGKKLKKYLELYNLQILYQKTGYILEHYKERTKLPKDFFTFCKKNILQSTRYLFNNMNRTDAIFNKKWQLVVPKDLITITEQEGNELV